MISAIGTTGYDVEKNRDEDNNIWHHFLNTFFELRNIVSAGIDDDQSATSSRLFLRFINKNYASAMTWL